MYTLSSLGRAIVRTDRLTGGLYLGMFTSGGILVLSTVRLLSSVNMSWYWSRLE